MGEEKGGVSSIGIMNEVDRFVAKLRAGGRRRLYLIDLWATLRTVNHDAADAHDGQHLLTILREAEGAGLLRISKDHDLSEDPPLPRSVLLVASEVTAPVAEGPRAVWRDELQWAAELDLNEEERAFLGQVRDFLCGISPDEPVVPLRERSLLITDDEKRLEAYLRGRLFRPGRLTLELLRCKRVHPPFVWTRKGTAPVLLVVENHHTYDTFRRVLESEDGIGFLAYGAGNQFTASVTSVAELEPRVERVLYYGDIDSMGLWIPIQASANAERERLPRVEPAGGLYRALIAEGHRGRASSSVPSGKSVKIDPRDVVRWLPSDLQEPILRILNRGERVAQEGLGYTRLRDTQFRRQVLRD